MRVFPVYTYIISLSLIFLIKMVKFLVTNLEINFWSGISLTRHFMKVLPRFLAFHSNTISNAYELRSRKVFSTNFIKHWIFVLFIIFEMKYHERLKNVVINCEDYLKSNKLVNYSMHRISVWNRAAVRSTFFFSKFSKEECNRTYFSIQVSKWMKMYHFYLTATQSRISEFDIFVCQFEYFQIISN